jgi:hypothetical protein
MIASISILHEIGRALSFALGMTSYRPQPVGSLE